MPTVLDRKCPYCGRITIVTVMNDKYDRWQAGEKIQNVFPELTALQRETLMTGFCSDSCWDKYLGGGE